MPSFARIGQCFVSTLARKAQRPTPSDTTRSDKVRSLEHSYGKECSRYCVLSYDDIQLGEVIGEGSFGSVHRGTLLKDAGLANRSDDVAIKVLNINLTFQLARRELSNLRKVSLQGGHPNVVQVHGANLFTRPYFIVMELATGPSLFDYIKQRQHTPIPMSLICDFSTQIVNGLMHMHACRIVHRDLKSMNVLLHHHATSDCTSERWDIKLVDLGAATIVRDGGRPNSYEVGTYRWMAPEMKGFSTPPQRSIADDESDDVEESSSSATSSSGAPYDMRVDIYGVGMLIFSMLARKVPFDNMSTLAAALAADRGVRPLLPESKGNVALQLEYIVRRCIAHDPADRPTLEELSNRLELLRTDPDQLLQDFEMELLELFRRQQ